MGEHQRMTWTRAQRKKWLQTHDAKAYYRNWSKANRARNALVDKAWRRRNPDKIRAMTRRRMRKHGAEIQAWRRDWYAKNKARICAENRARHKEKRAFLNSLKRRPCADCRRRFPPYVMDFDHRRGTKEFMIGRLLSASLERLTREIEKCDVVCANCHRIRTHSRVGRR